MEKVIKALLMNPQGDILFLIRGATHPSYAHQADLTGGIIEDGESAEAALVREVSEECAIDISGKEIQIIAEQDYESKSHYILALVILDTLEPKLSWEHEDYFVCNLKDIKSNKKLQEAKDPYVIFAYKAICENID